MAAEIDLERYLGEEDPDTPLHVLRYTCTQHISWMLNKEMQLRPGQRYIPNFGGLGELIGLEGLAISEMARRDNPGLEILQLWKERRDLKPTIGNLIKYLVMLDREDILTDTLGRIKEEIQIYKDSQQHLAIQCEKVSSANYVEETNRILTIDDVIEGQAIYDAFICFHAEDVDFVKTMILKLEDPREYGFRFFVPGRNNLVGTNSNALTTKIISERCRHMIVVLSSSFLESQACEFQTAYAFSLSPGARDKKIVPIKIETCRTPDILQIMACCDFTNHNLLDWCWQRLAMSIMCPMPNSDFLGTHRFQPPVGSALAAWARVGMSETGGGRRASPVTSKNIYPDSGFASSSFRRGLATAPVSSSHSNSSRQGHASAGAQSLTAPISLPGPSAQRDKSPGPVSQAFKRFTQTLSSSKIQKKKHKTTTVTTIPTTTTTTTTNNNNNNNTTNNQPEETTTPM